MIIDGHSHLFQARWPCDNLPQNVDVLGEVDWQSLVAGLSEIGVEKVVTLAQEMTRVWDAWLGSNKLAADLQRKCPEQILGVAGAEALDKQDKFNAARLKEVETSVREHRLRGLLLTPPYGHYFANDKRVYPFYQKAVELDIPIYFHQAAQFGETVLAPMKYARPWLLDDIVIDFPDLRINVEHMGYPWTEELIAVMAHAPNVYTDISALFRRPTVLAWNLVLAKEYGVINRVIYGTDYVGSDIRHYLQQLKDEVEYCRVEINKTLKRSGWPTLTEEEIDGMLGGNVARFLKIT
ncbi:TPA: amidohydrolase [Candidatus Poribacteria bacterium]|nr:amidohydrolase [Candidatus Poribacteria bacterium]